MLALGVGVLIPREVPSAAWTRRFGWPLPCLEAPFTWYAPPAGVTPAPASVNIVPLVIDAAFYGLVAGLATAALKTILRLRDRDPRACLHCGYLLAGLAKDTPCPECGKARNAATPPPSS